MTLTENVESVDGVEMYRISPLDAIDPFLMTVVSDSDLWMFLSSTGGLTAGRVEPEGCIFPYETDDRLHHLSGRVGPITVLRVTRSSGTTVWEPFTTRGPNTRRSLLKSVLGNAVVFEEQHLELGLTLRYRWAPSDRFGWVRTVTLGADADSEVCSVEVVDGLLDVMPWGVGVAFQQSMSNLANAYRRSEIVDSGIGIFALEALIVDRPEPAEALRATTVWSTGLAESGLTLDPGALETLRDGGQFSEVLTRTGRPGSFLVHTTLDLEPGRTHRWHIVADVAQRHGDIARTDAALQSPVDLSRQVDDDIEACSAELRNIVAGADGVQTTCEPKVDAHHFANTLFNVMRGGTFAGGTAIESRRFSSFIAERNADVAERRAAWLAELPGSIDVTELRNRASDVGDADLTRLAHEYLPLSFSRRHGDPSRPWNQFAIRVRDDDGAPLLTYQGNWRDIFQNWEALCRTYPSFLPSVIAKFVNASTAEGFNPYRITSDGIDWEVPEPENPWSGIGYWGDHQIVYLHRLLNTQRNHDPAWLPAELSRQAYAFADVPYRLSPFEQLVQDPKDTIEFDVQAAADVAERVDRIGADGRLVAAADGGIVHVTLLEKLLIPALAKLSNFVPRGGIWMNTQRPEWNDANNALVGFGLSMVTLAHLRRYLQLLDEVTDDLADAMPVSAEVITWIEQVTAALESHDHLVGATSIDDTDRARIVRELGLAFERYRTMLQAAGPSAPASLEPETLRRLLRTSIRHLDDSLEAARRSDGLYDAYNLVAFSDGGTRASVRHLQEMLEGQVAAISSGSLDVDQVVALLHTMYESDLYRRDVDSFVLYPARTRPPFLERNQVPTDAVESNALLAALIEAGDDALITRDVNNSYHFNADFKNASDLSLALASLSGTEFEQLARLHGPATLDLYEQVFHHHAFTGRSSTMFAYEGIGSVYWHMVAKLLVAVQEVILEAPAATNAASLGELVRLYDRVRDGLGFNRSAAQYGAFPTDPYSHTPAHAGAQQPGMTGQVKEELLTRWAELGLVVSRGSVKFTPALIASREFRAEAGELSYLDVAGGSRSLEVPAGSVAFTLCRVPVVVHASGTGWRIMIAYSDSDRREVETSSLDAETSRQIFEHTGQVTRLDVFMPRQEIR